MQHSPATSGTLPVTSLDKLCFLAQALLDAPRAKYKNKAHFTSNVRESYVQYNYTTVGCTSTRTRLTMHARQINCTNMVEISSDTCAMGI